MHAKGRGKRGKSPPRDDDEEEEEILFDIDQGGWSVEALASLGTPPARESSTTTTMKANNNTATISSSLDDDGWGVFAVGDEPRQEEEPDDKIDSSSPPPLDEKTRQSVEARLGGLLSEEMGDQVEYDGELGQAALSLLGSMTREDLRRLEVAQVRARKDAEEERIKRRQRGSPYKTHKKLRIIAGEAAGTYLLSPSDERTRPMMEKVRGATFSMLLSMCGLGGDAGQLPQDARWLDIYAGTGSIGLEALSRGVGSCHFVEMDQFVVDKVLRPNVKACKMVDQVTIHAGAAEDFLGRALKAPTFAGGPFDFVSACPPYEKVSYAEMFAMLDQSPLVHNESYVLVEYPRKEAEVVPNRLGPLVKFRDRRYGRTFLAIWGPASLLEEGEESLW